MQNTAEKQFQINPKAKYYISAGRQTKMFTLRECWAERVWSGQGFSGGWVIEEFDCYVCTLSNNAEKAAAKAAEMVGCEVPFSIDEDLNEIRRRSSEDVEAEKLAAEKEREKNYQEAQSRANLIGMDYLNSGCWPFGEYKSRKFDQAPNDYIQYFQHKKAETGIDAHARISKRLQELLRAKFPDLNYSELPAPNNEYFGVVGDRLEMKGLLIKHFSFEGHYGLQKVYQFIETDGALLVYMGSAWLKTIEGEDLQIGIEYSFTAGIKKHDVYKGENQTSVKIIKKIKRETPIKGLTIKIKNEFGLVETFVFDHIEAFEAHVKRTIIYLLEFENQDDYQPIIDQWVQALESAKSEKGS